MSFWAACIAQFVLTLWAAVAWALYFRYAAAGKAARAAWCDVAIVVIGIVNIVSVADDYRLIAPVAVAAWLGTYWGVKYKFK